ncbi:thioredoxin-dependent thiol peroxidase [Candidatus Marsarchaeota G1 archaeon BE_D]|jgi:peroxiredoxin Q/BCP|uniref:thioredoxin-dependent peroxiredoxin n=4 Tax=Candidatus Marsarchaeota TaxID=1978152 RepID=A0A2R6AKA8_9ARCH|nr:MAG: thioredoxin-dependent thiol peroxidase [Candidatus Marsarchaeota G1 archaeon BE_D]PSN88898.1 MAG: thioredoxin-dependent thiol peroxidase [Candidatus Marsarchaeota G1 archaeon OSP_C]
MSTEIAEGMEAPDFELKDQKGNVISLKNFRGKKVVLYFYPKDDTPGCTKEACSFRDNMDKIIEKGAIVIGISNDDLKSHEKFSKKYNLNFSLLSDVDRRVSIKYGVYKKKNLYGKIVWGIERSTFIIDEQGKIKKIFRKVNVEGHVDEVLKHL